MNDLFQSVQEVSHMAQVYAKAVGVRANSPWPLSLVGGLNVGIEAARLVLPSAPITVEATKIRMTLTTKFFPAFGLLARIPSSLALLIGNRIDRLCIASGNWEAHELRIEDHPTWKYVAHAIAYDRTGDAEHLSTIRRIGMDAWKNGDPLGRLRRVTEFRKVATNTWTLDDVKSYAERVIGLARRIEVTKSVPHSEILSDESDRSDDNVGVAVDASGNLVHFRTGHHRLMIAQQLGVLKVPVVVRLVHAAWLLEAANLSARDLKGMIRTWREDDLRNVRAIVGEYVVRNFESGLITQPAAPRT